MNDMHCFIFLCIRKLIKPLSTKVDIFVSEELSQKSKSVIKIHACDSYKNTPNRTKLFIFDFFFHPVVEAE